MGDPRSVVEKLKDELIPSLASGAVGALAASFIMGVDLNLILNVGNMEVPAWVAVGGTIAAADLVAYASKDFVLEKIPTFKNYGGLENRILPPVLAGGATYLLFRTAISSDVSLTNSFLLGAGSSIVGRYATDAMMNMDKNSA